MLDGIFIPTASSKAICDPSRYLFWPSVPPSLAGFWERVSRTLARKWVCVHSDQSEAVCAPCGADRLGRTSSLLSVRQFPHRQWKKQLQVFLVQYNFLIFSLPARNISYPLWNITFQYMFSLLIVIFDYCWAVFSLKTGFLTDSSG